MARYRSWWRLRQVRHRDAVALSVLSSASLLAGELANQDLPTLYARYLGPVANDPALFVLRLGLILLAFTTVFGGILVLLGGIHFSWGRVSRGRFLLGLGVGFGLIGLLGKIAQATLATGTPMGVLVTLTTTLTGLGILLGVASQVIMAEYALMLKKHARNAWRQWRRANRPAARNRSRGTAGRD